MSNKSQAPFAMWPNFPSGLRVLLVDTDHGARGDAQRLLNECAYLVTSCSTATEAVTQLVDPSAVFDVLLIDMKLVTSGDINLLKTVESARGAALIIMSDGATPVELLNGIKQGAVDCMEKPLSPLKVRTLWQHKVRKMMAETRHSDTCTSSLQTAAPTQAASPDLASAAMFHTSAGNQGQHEGEGTPGSASAESDVVLLDSLMDVGPSPIGHNPNSDLSTLTSHAGLQQIKTDKMNMDSFSATSTSTCNVLDAKASCSQAQMASCPPGQQWMGTVFPMPGMNGLPWCMPFGGMPMPNPGSMMAGMLPGMLPFMRWPAPVLPGNAGMLPPFPPYGMPPMGCFPMGPPGTPDFMTAAMGGAAFMPGAGFPGMPGPGNGHMGLGMGMPMQVPMNAQTMVFPVPQPPVQGSPAVQAMQQAQQQAQPAQQQQQAVQSQQQMQHHPNNGVNSTDAGLQSPLGLQLKKSDSLLDLLAETLMNTTNSNSTAC